MATITLAQVPSCIGRATVIFSHGGVPFKRIKYRLIVVYSYTWGRFYCILGNMVGGIFYCQHVFDAQRKHVWSRKIPPQITLKGET